MQRITPFLWFDNQAEEAAEYYTSVFPNSKITGVDRVGESTEHPATIVEFVLDGVEYMALNGGPQHFTFNESISFYVTCQNQEEVDDLWTKLTADGGEEGPCGWLKDKYGLSWQIVPTALRELLSDPDRTKANQVMKAMLGMSKIEIQGLRDAYAG